MTEERWKQVRNLPEVPEDVWFSFYRENGGVLEFNEFWEVFSKMLAIEPIIHCNDNIARKVSLKSSLDRLYSYYNKKFAL